MAIKDKTLLHKTAKSPEILIIVAFKKYIAQRSNYEEELQKTCSMLSTYEQQISNST